MDNDTTGECAELLRRVSRAKDTHITRPWQALSAESTNHIKIITNGIQSKYARNGTGSQIAQESMLGEQSGVS